MTCKVGTKEYHFTGESMDKGFARFGTKPTDTNVSTRETLVSLLTSHSIGFCTTSILRWDRFAIR